MSFAEKAEMYLELGWPVFPTRGKVPLTKHGMMDASTDPEVIIGWDQTFPDANIALATGSPSGITVMDIDGPEGEESFRMLKRLLAWRYQDDQPAVKTARGRHLYFRGSEVGNSTGYLGQGIDIKGNGGACTLPPSLHEKGVRYYWMHPIESVSDIPYFPLSLTRLLNQRDMWRLDPRRGMVKLQQPKYERKHNTPPDLDRLASMVLRARKGERNHTLNRAAFLAGKAVSAGAVSQADATAALSAAALQAGLQRHEIRATIASGLRSGAIK